MDGTQITILQRFYSEGILNSRTCLLGRLALRLEHSHILSDKM